jgi:hypothetical protein
MDLTERINQMDHFTNTFILLFILPMSNDQGMSWIMICAFSMIAYGL